MNWPFDVTISPEQEQLLVDYARELKRVNQRFNLISRQDEARLLEHHIGHCLAFGLRLFPDLAHVVDWGTGGGLPAIPLAILNPSLRVTGVDSNNKKTRSVERFARLLDLNNVDAVHARAETVRLGHDISVSRATAPLATLWSWHTGSARSEKASTPAQDGIWSTGLWCLKGGDLTAEIDDLLEVNPGLEITRIKLKDHTDDAYFATKEMVGVTLSD